MWIRFQFFFSACLKWSQFVIEIFIEINYVESAPISQLLTVPLRSFPYYIPVTKKYWKQLNNFTEESKRSSRFKTILFHCRKARKSSLFIIVKFGNENIYAGDKKMEKMAEARRRSWWGAEVLIAELRCVKGTLHEYRTLECGKRSHRVFRLRPRWITSTRFHYIRCIRCIRCIRRRCFVSSLPAIQINCKFCHWFQVRNNIESIFQCGAFRWSFQSGSRAGVN